MDKIELFNNPLLASAIIFLGYLVTSALLKKTIDGLFLGIKKTRLNEKTIAKSKTIRTFLKNTLDFILFFIIILIILSQFGINIIPLITGASVLGLAISFGAQTVVKDLISGFFILLEDQFNVGDYVKIGNFEGTVHKLTMRLTVIRDQKGNLIYIPNSQITSVIRLNEIKSKKEVKK